LTSPAGCTNHGGMSFDNRITRTPDAYDAARGADVLAQLPGLPAATTALIGGAAGCSPYLAGLIAQEKDWLIPALDAPEAAMEACLASLPDLPLDALPQDLRQMKRRVALLTALADLGGIWPLETVTGTLTRFADAAVSAAITRLVAGEVARGTLPAGDDPRDCAGMVVLAMGKMGAHELNYSSDIDLICLFDDSRYAPDDLFEARAAFIRVTRRMTAILSDVKQGGYVFRTDLRLRPDASVMPVCLSMEAAERYYESVGRTWERAAYIKARVAAGDRAAGARFLTSLRPFVWRKHLDFAAIQDAHDMRLKIRDHKGLGGALVLEGHDMKLGRGGIREIEFFTQTRQLIAGGRDASLRHRGTEAGLEALSAAGWIPDEAAIALTDHYRQHRLVEHRLQMINDAQTHHLPQDAAGFDRLAAFMGISAADLRADLTTRLNAVHELTEGFFAPDARPKAQITWGQDVVARWQDYPALRSTRASQIFDRIAPQIMTSLAEAARPEEALAQFDAFLAGLPAGVQLFSLFEANPQLTQLIVDIAATAPALAQYLSRNAAVLDAVIGGGFFTPWPGMAALRDALAQHLAGQTDYESQLIAARRWAKEWHFRIGVHHLRGLIDAASSGRQYADLAEAVIGAVWPLVVAEFARKHGAPPGRGGAVLGMGSLGARLLNAASDLDLIVIYDPAGVEASEGPRPLATRAYFARLTQALITALSAQMSEGRLYEVDMRLRPSGRQGPVATALPAFTTYQRDEAWTWEHLALTRARVIAGDAGLAAEIETFRQNLLRDKGQGASILADVADMRARLAQAKGASGPWDAKNGPGRLQDIELIAQTAALIAGTAARNVGAQLRAGRDAGWLSADDCACLTRAHGLLWNLQAAGRLLTGGALDPQDLGEGGKRMILRDLNSDDLDDLLARMTALHQAAAAVIDRKVQP
jgi:glutamate-ammonia-ligase adenylyltransferase